jgi:lipoic acid synthetase
MNLRHIVITSVNRDELPDGGSVIWAETIRCIRKRSPRTSVEVLIPDFCGDPDALKQVIDEQPDILSHNMETVRRLYPAVRPQARYDCSVELLRRSKEACLVTKTGIMVGIGETDEEVKQLIKDVFEGSRPRERRGAKGGSVGGGCDILTIGQYLQPTRNHLPVARWVTPDQFTEYKRLGEAFGFRHVESGPLVRSSYHAEDQVLELQQ